MLRTFDSAEVRSAKLATRQKLATTLKLTLKMGSSLELKLTTSQYLTIMIWSERRDHSLVFV